MALAPPAPEAPPAQAPLRPHGTVREDWRGFVLRTPDWWLGAASLVAWMALTAMFLGMATGSLHAGHGGAGGGAAELSYGALLASWALMVVAMMLPLVREQARWLALRSLRRDSRRVVATFTLAYLALWVAFGAVAIAVLEPVRGSLWAVALALAVAAVWQCAPARRRLLRRCGVQRAPAVHGRRALADRLRAGLLAGRRCIGTCGPLMAPMAIAHHPALMVGAALVVAGERRQAPDPETRGGRRGEALAIGAAALAVAAWSVLGRG
jgi:predicted metal-binding membrane protein